MKPGVRVAVVFGKSKIYTALVYKIHTQTPIGYDAKDIHQILDEKPIVNQFQLKFWEWIASYYMCTLGEVYRAALPSAFLLESETVVELARDVEVREEDLANEAFLIFEALQHQSQLNIAQITEIIDKKNVFPLLFEMMENNIIVIKEQLYQQYKPKLVNYIKIHQRWDSGEKLQELLEELSRAKKQREAVLYYFQKKATKNPIALKTFLNEANVSRNIINELVKKEVFELYQLQKDRINFSESNSDLKHLSEAQNNALTSIETIFKNKQVVLLKGITSSGKTEIYTKLIKQKLKDNKQVLFLLPEIAITTQLISRLKQYFGEYLSVYHSKYSMNERVEVYKNILQNKQKARLILGVRSALFLPFSNLDLIIVDEEHEVTYKQFDPAPRYHARDSAIVLANFFKAKVLLGSATPSIESYYNTTVNKYGLVNLTKRYGNVLLPEMELIDIKEKYRKKRMTGHFSDRLIKLIQETLNEKKQVILFQNRRGFAPVVTCETCGVSPQCPNCDVSLTYHDFKKELKCHYCGYKEAMLHNCNACGSTELNTKGFGTEQIEQELKQLFPEEKIGRMDFDTTKGKYSYEKIIEAFQAQEISVLVGTQMLSKGLDFSNVALVGIMNADNMLNYPDFRAYERSFQLMVQVSGRAGRASERGKVAIQTFNPYHQILQQVTVNDYKAMFNEQLNERWQYHYPPYYRIIKLTLKHKNNIEVSNAATWLGKAMRQVFNEQVLGPTTPAISRIRNQYLQNITLKIPQKQSLLTTKKQLQKIINTFEAVKDFRAVRLIVDVDSY